MTGTRIGQQQQSEIIQDLTTKVARLTNPGPAFTDPISIFSLTLGAGSSVQVAFRCGIEEGVDSIQIYRGATRDFGTAKQLTSYPASGTIRRTINYTDTDSSLSGTTPWYWLRIIPANQNNAPILHRPQGIKVP